MKRKAAKQVLHFGGESAGPTWMPDEEFLKTEQALLQYVATTWVHQNRVPTEPPELTRFEITRLWPAYRAFLKSGGQLEKRGRSLEEEWLLFQLGLKSPVTCLLNSVQPEQPAGRISRLRLLTASEIWVEFQRWYENPALDRPLLPDKPAAICPTSLLVYDGAKVAHVIAAFSVWANELHFQDPWPGRSLLCAENNAAGVRARKSNFIKPGWRITAKEFQRIVFAVFLYEYPPRLLRKAIELTEEERQAAEQSDFMTNVARRLNKEAAARPVKGRIQGVTSISQLEAGARLGIMWRVKLALNDGADVNESGDLGTPLHGAAANGHLDIVQLLVEHGADHHVIDPAGKTPEELASENGHLAVVDYLRSLG
jgi:hypothetical protein